MGLEGSCCIEMFCCGPLHYCSLLAVMGSWGRRLDKDVEKQDRIIRNTHSRIFPGAAVPAVFAFLLHGAPRLSVRDRSLYFA